LRNCRCRSIGDALAEKRLGWPSLSVHGTRVYGQSLLSRQGIQVSDLLEELFWYCTVQFLRKTHIVIKPAKSNVQYRRHVSRYLITTSSDAIVNSLGNTPSALPDYHGLTSKLLIHVFDPQLTRYSSPYRCLNPKQKSSSNASIIQQTIIFLFSTVTWARTILSTYQENFLGIQRQPTIGKLRVPRSLHGICKQCRHIKSINTLEDTTSRLPHFRVELGACSDAHTVFIGSTTLAKAAVGCDPDAVGPNSGRISGDFVYSSRTYSSSPDTMSRFLAWHYTSRTFRTLGTTLPRPYPGY
jgi:hypothetical protein